MSPCTSALLTAFAFLATSAAAYGQLSPSAIWATTAPSRFQAQSEITYLTVDGHESKLDIYRRRGGLAQGAQSAPTLIYIHGGGWMSGHKGDGMMYTLAWLEMGWNVVNVEYRLGGVAPAPAAVEDCLCALRWLVANATQYGVDPARIIVMGDSSGGHLALTTGMTPGSAGLDKPCNPSGEAPMPKVAGIVNWYGITDLTALRTGADKRPYAIDWLAKAADPDALARLVSPVTWVRADLPPIITIHGDSDPTVPYSQALRLRDALNAAHARNQLVTIPGGKHGGFTAEERIRAYVDIRRFLARYGLPTAIEGDR